MFSYFELKVFNVVKCMCEWDKIDIKKNINGNQLTNAAFIFFRWLNDVEFL